MSTFSFVSLLARDFSNGFLVAEACSRYFPDLFSPHAFENGNSLSCKSTNWHQLQKAFKKIGFVMDNTQVAEVIHCKNEGVCTLIENLFEFLSGKDIKREVAPETQSIDETPSFAR